MKALAMVLAVGSLAVSGCGGSSARLGTVVGGIEPGGIHPIGTYIGGRVTVVGRSGHVVATVTAQPGQLFRLRLAAGSYELKARQVDQPCQGHVVVRAAVTRRANVICEGK